MWFDARAKLAELEGQPPALMVLTPEELARDLFEERAAIREFEGGQSRAEAEAAALVEAEQAAGVAVERLRALIGGKR